MKISVIIPVYNGAKYLAEAINSVLKQSLKASEIIVIDDGSTDDSAAIVKSFGEKIKYVYQANRGVSSARNLGIKLAKGDYLAFLDQDDQYLPEKFANESKAFENTPGTMVVEAKWRYLFANDELKASYMYKDQVDTDCYGYFLGSYLFRKEVFAAIGGFNSLFDGNEDVDLLMRIRDSKLMITRLEHLSLLYRYHDNNTSKSEDFTNNLREKTLKMLELAIKARRKQ